MYTWQLARSLFPKPTQKKNIYFYFPTKIPQFWPKVYNDSSRCPDSVTIFPPRPFYFSANWENVYIENHSDILCDSLRKNLWFIVLRNFSGDLHQYPGVGEMCVSLKYEWLLIKNLSDETESHWDSSSSSSEFICVSLLIPLQTHNCFMFDYFGENWRKFLLQDYDLSSLNQTTVKSWENYVKFWVKVWTPFARQNPKEKTNFILKLSIFQHESRVVWDWMCLI